VTSISARQGQEVTSYRSGRNTKDPAQSHFDPKWLDSGMVDRDECTRRVGQRKLYTSMPKSERDPGSSSRDRTCAHATSALSCRQSEVVLMMVL
jgi:hypothetical protein